MCRITSVQYVQLQSHFYSVCVCLCSISHTVCYSSSVESYSRRIPGRLQSDKHGPDETGPVPGRSTSRVQDSSNSPTTSGQRSAAGSRGQRETESH